MASGRNRSGNRAIKFVLALVLIVLGLAGLVLPFLQGILFLVIGLLLLADVIPSVARFVRRLEARNEHVARISDAAHRNIDAFFDRPWLVFLVLLTALATIVWGAYLLFR